MKISTLATLAALTLSAVLAGCSGPAIQTYSSSYGALKDAGFQLPSIPIYKVPSQYHRQLVRYETKEKPGTVIVDTGEKHLYLVMEDGKAMRYGIGVGREGFEWSGTARVGMKREWPVWTPPSEMIDREPKLAKYRKGMEPGLIATEMTAPVIAQYEERAMAGLTLIPRVGQPHDIGCIVASLATGKLPYTTGQVISADAGMLVPRF